MTRFARHLVSLFRPSVRITSQNLHFKNIHKYRINNFGRFCSSDSNFIPGTYKIEFTCNVCKTRSEKKFSKQAYLKGVVLIRCLSCEKIHLIADNLKWFRDDKINISDIMKEKGEEVLEITGIQNAHKEEDKLEDEPLKL